MPWSLGLRGPSRVRGKGGGSQDVAVMSTRDQNLPSTPWREDETGKLTGGPQDPGEGDVWGFITPSASAQE